MNKRNLSGIYYREKVGDKYENICFEELSKERQKEILVTNANHDFKNNMIMRLSEVINEIGDITGIAKE